MSTAINYLRLHVDADGASHFQPAEMPTQPCHFAPPAPPFNISTFSPALRSGFLVVPAGWVGDWHPSPIRMWIFVLEGEMEFVASDGEHRLAASGTTLLLEDTVGRGHRSRVMGDKAAKLAIVELER